MHQAETYSVLGSGVEGLLLDTADTLAVNGGDLDVTLITPGGAPRVPDDVVVLAGGSVSAVADSGDGVVEVGTAGGGVHDAGLVHLEDELVGLNGDGSGGGGNGSLELGNGVGLNVGVRADEDLLLGGIGLAGAGDTGSRGVGVVTLELLGGLLEVLEGGVLPTTVATEGGLVAGDNLLLGEGEELAGLQEVSTLNGAGGRESPAGAASGLILDGVDGTLGSPVDLSLSGLGELDNVLGLSTAATKNSLVLGVGPGGELVVTKLEVSLLSVDLVDGSILGGVELISELVLLLGAVGEAEVDHVLLEGTLEGLVLGRLLVAVVGLDTGPGGGFAEELHLYLIYYNYWSIFDYKPYV